MGLFDFLKKLSGSGDSMLDVKPSSSSGTSAWDSVQNTQSAQETHRQEVSASGNEVLSYNPRSCYHCSVTRANAYNYQPGVRNLYDYVGEPVNYFIDVLRTNFPSYEVVQNVQVVQNGAYATLALKNQDRIVCAIDLQHQGSSRYQLYTECRKAGIGHTNFYIDHEGWWNMEPYVVARINEVMR